MAWIRTFGASTAGTNWHWVHLLFYGTLLFFMLYTGYVVVRWLIRDIREERKERTKGAKLIATLGEPQQVATDTVIPTRKSGTTKVLLAALAFFAGSLVGFDFGERWGYSKRSAEFVDNTHIYRDVLVVDRYDSLHYRLRPAGMDAYSFVFCPESRLDFEPGQKMRYLTYEQHQGCKSVAGRNGYEFYQDDHGQRLSYREEMVANGY